MGLRHGQAVFILVKSGICIQGQKHPSSERLCVPFPQLHNLQKLQTARPYQRSAAQTSLQPGSLFSVNWSFAGFTDQQTMEPGVISVSLRRVETVRLKAKYMCLSFNSNR